MNGFRKWVALMLSVCLLMGAAAFAEGTAEVTEAVPVAAVELADDTLLATVNGVAITWGDLRGEYDALVAEFGTARDMTATENINLFRAYVLNVEIATILMDQKMKASGIGTLSDEDTAEIYAMADAGLEDAIVDYMATNLNITEESTEEEKAQARTIAEGAYLEAGYSQESVREMFLEEELFARLYNAITQDVVVTDAEVEAVYQDKVANDKLLFENNITAYVEHNASVDEAMWMAMFSGTAPTSEYAWYKPEGFRAVKHILLPVDETLMGEYNGMQARLEEQLGEEAAAMEEDAETAAEVTQAPEEATEGAEDEAPAEEALPPITQGDVDAAKANILASKADIINEINDKIAEGVDFDTLIAEYGLDENGEPSDPGMVNEPYKTAGYEVARESTGYAMPFVDAAFSVDSIGDVSAPYLSSFGIHIVKYIGDVPGGPVEMTAEEREALRQSMLEDKRAERYTAEMTAWQDAAQIDYTGVVPSIAELEAQEEADEAVVATEDSAEALPEDENAEAAPAQ